MGVLRSKFPDYSISCDYASDECCLTCVTLSVHLEKL